MSVYQLFLKSVFLLFLAGTSRPEPDVPPLYDEANLIKIGLLVPDNKSFAARQGAELAVRIANEKAGADGRHFKLIVKTMEGPWGFGSKQAIDLIFNDKVSALLGSHDGRNAHLVEQAATKSRVVFMSAWSGDPGLSQAFVPWFFNCVPNYNQQAESFIEEIYNKRKLQKIVAVSDNGYDSNMALECFLKRTQLARKPEPIKIIYSESDNIQNILDQIIKNNPEGLVLFGDADFSKRLDPLVKKFNKKIRLFGSASLLNEEYYSLKEYEYVFFNSCGGITGRNSVTFKYKYQAAYGIAPGVVAAFAFDGMNLLIDAISKGGTDRESIQKTLLKLNYEGVTGTIKFDEKGNRISNPAMIQIKNGVPVPVEKH